MEDSFDLYLSAGNTHGYLPLANAVCAYETVASICDKNFKEEPVEGKKYYLDFLHFCIKIFIGIIAKNQKSELEVKLKAFELKNFIFSTMIEDLILAIGKHSGTEDLVEVVYRF